MPLQHMKYQLDLIGLGDSADAQRRAGAAAKANMLATHVGCVSKRPDGPAS